MLRNRLKQLRARENINQQELAISIGVSRQTISLIERGVSEPSILIALRLSHFFKESLDQIFYLDT